MIRRLFCLLCAALLLFSALPATAEEAGPEVLSYDFDLSFALNADAFPPRSRTRAAGYADLLAAISLKGNVTWCPDKDSMDMNATLSYPDRPGLTYPFRLYGTSSWLYFTSPLLNNEIIGLNMNAAMEFAYKAKNTLNMPLPTLVFLYPHATEYAFGKLAKSWRKAVGSFTRSRKIPVSKLKKLETEWDQIVRTNRRLQVWKMALMDISKAPYAIEAEFANLPGYWKIVTGGKALHVKFGKGSEVWTNAAGNTLFSRVETEDSFTLSLSLPASENGYIPELSVTGRSEDQTASFSLSGSLARETPAGAGPAVSAPGDTEAGSYPEDEEAVYPEVYEDEDAIYDEFPEFEDDGEDDYSEYGEYGDLSGYGEYGEYGELAGVPEFPDLLLQIRAEGAGIPLSLPADSDFTVSASVRGAAYPETAYVLRGQTKKDGTVNLSLCNPPESGAAPAEVFRVTGTLIPAEAESVPNFKKVNRDGVYNVFAFNEQSLADFVNRMLPLLVRSALSFLDAAPTSAVQSFLDDMADLGVTEMLLQ